MREMQKTLFHESSPADILTLHVHASYEPCLKFSLHILKYWPKIQIKDLVDSGKFLIKFWTISAWIFFFSFSYPPTAAVTITVINKYEICSADSQSYFSHILPNSTQSPCSSNVFFLWQPFICGSEPFPTKCFISIQKLVSYSKTLIIILFIMSRGTKYWPINFLSLECWQFFPIWYQENLDGKPSVSHLRVLGVLFHEGKDNPTLPRDYWLIGQPLSSDVISLFWHSFFHASCLILEFFIVASSLYSI